MNKLAMEYGTGSPRNSGEYTSGTGSALAAGASRRGTKVRHELNAVFAIMARDITIALKSPGTIIMSLAMPLTMMGMLGGTLSQNMGGGLDFNYGEFMLVGMMINMLFMITTMGMTSLVEDHVTDFTQEMLVSPISRHTLAVGKILGSSFGAFISMFGTLAVGAVMGYTLTPWQLLMIILISPLMCLSGGALALIVIGLIKNNKTANIAVMIITMPQMFLSGAIIPISHSDGLLLGLSRAMPMTYCLDLARAIVCAGTPDYDSVVMFNPVVNLIIIVAFTVGCLIIGTYFFSRSEKKR